MKKNAENEQTPLDDIKADIRQGKEYDVIAERWEISIGYVKKIASDMRKNDEKLPDRRGSEWKRLQFIDRNYRRYY